MNIALDATNILLEVGTNEMEILEFYIEEEGAPDSPPERIFFGMNVAKVMEVIESPDREVRAHSRNSCFLGTIPLREHILPLIDLSEWLGIRRARKKDEVVIVTEFSKAVTGFLVSGVTEIHRMGWEEVKSPGTFLSHVVEAAIVGTVERNGRLVQLLDMESVLADLNPKDMEDSLTASVRSEVNYPVFIADDSPTIRSMLERKLKAANFSPFAAESGKEALEWLWRLKERSLAEGRDIFDFVRIVVADIEMPGMDGFTLTKNIKNDPVLGKLPVILYSSIITEELRHKGVSVGADDQISKPEMDHMAERAIRLIEG